MSDIITAENLQLWYGDTHALKGIDMAIPEKNITALIGPSGCGKSTFLKTLNRMNDLIPSVRITGEVRYNGRSIFDKDVDVCALRRDIGMVFQKPNPFPMSIYDNIAYGPRTHGIRSKAKLDEIVERSARNAAIWSCIWVGLALVFAGYIGYSFGSEQVQLFLTGYLLEKSLSVDNLFVIMAIFSSFAVKDAFQHRVLYYGVLGALVLRLIFVAAGSSLVAMFGPYALASFGIFVLWTAWKMWQSMHSGEKEEIVDYSEHWAVRYTKRFIPVHNQLSGHDFFVKAPDTTGKLIWKATPLFLCLFVVEVSDVMFAFDSVPAIIAVTHDPFLVYTSNVFAILGLRSMYFLLAAGKRYLRHLEKSVVIILAYIGVKMLLDVVGIVHISPLISLGVVIGLLAIGILASLLPEKSAK